MRQASGLLLAIAGTFGMAYAALGYDAAYQIGYGALTLMAAMISATFAILWVTRATPLALGMAFSWAGAASVLGWWWLWNLMERPAEMRDSAVLFGFLSLYFVGAILHFMVIQRSLCLRERTFLVPVAISVAVSALLHLTM